MSQLAYTRRTRFDAPVTILIADDHADRRETFANAFVGEASGQFRIIVESSLSETMQRLRAQPIDALLMHHESFGGHYDILFAEATRSSDRISVVLVCPDGLESIVPLDFCEHVHETSDYAERLPMITRMLVQQQRMFLALSAAETHALHRTLHDGLTGLANRAMLLDRIDRAMKRSKGNPDAGFALVFVDLDRFKVINDSLGHTIGDHILMEVAMRLTESVRESDTVARIAADEFMILLEGISSGQDALRVGEKIQARLAEPIEYEGRVFRLTASLGIALAGSQHDEPLDLFREADTAMHAAKAKGRACKVLFGSAMRDRAVLLFDIENELPRAIQEGQIQVFFQPIFAIDSLKIVGCEALVRWLHPERGMISPIDFVPVAESTGLIGMLGQYVLTQSCIHCAQWNRSLAPRDQLRVSVNVSPAQFRGWDVCEQVRQAIERSGLDSHHLALEVTESLFIDNLENTARTLHQLRDMGCSIYLDDFGTGYSSLSYLVNLPINVLKVDRAFIKDLTNRPDHVKLTRGIISLAHSLDLSVTAEGIETIEQLDALRELACEYGQGFYFSRPVPAADFWRMLTPIAIAA